MSNSPLPAVELSPPEAVESVNDTPTPRASRWLGGWTFRCKFAVYGVLARIRRRVAIVTEFIHESCREAVRSMVLFCRENRYINSLWKNTRRTIVFGVVAGSLIALGIESIFIVNVSASAVILRLGHYERSHDPGLALKFPLFEQKYIVNTQSVLQEDFGFKQYTPPPRPQTDAEIEAAEHMAEVVAGQHAEVNNNLNSGSMMSDLQRGPQVTRDYVIEQNPPPAQPLDPQAESEQVLERIDRHAEAAQNVIPPDGKVPVPEEMKMLTGDLNIVFVTWSVQYEITDGKKYLFHSADVRQNIRDVAVVSMRTAVGDRLDRDILSTGRDGIARDAKRLMQSILDQYDIGIQITDVLILDANPPDQVRGAFHRVNEAKQEMEEMIQRAQGEYNSVVPQSYGKAERLVLESKAYAIQLRSKAQGEATRFDAILAEYKKSPEVIRDRYYIEAMEDLYTRMSVTLIDSGLKGILPLFPGHNPQETWTRDRAALATQHPAVQREMTQPALAPSQGTPAYEPAPTPPPAGAAEVLPPSQPQASAAQEIPPASLIQEPPASAGAAASATPAQPREAPPSANRVEPLSLPSRAANSR